MSEGLLQVSVPIVGSIAVVVVGYVLNEWSKRRDAAYRRKERRYRGLLDAFRGFYAGAPSQASTELRQNFLNELTLAWLYCPDSVIRAGNRFLEAVRVGATVTPEEREAAGRAFILALRSDLRGRTDLTPEDFFVGSPNPHERL